MDETARYLKRASLTWEMLRVVYNLVLLAEGLWILRKVLAPVFLDGPGVLILLFGVVANAFYCLGPLLETYAYVGFAERIGRARYVLFATGLLFSMWFVFKWAMLAASQF